MRNVLMLAAAVFLTVGVVVPAGAASLPVTTQDRHRNLAPTITSDGGGNTASIEVTEGTTSVTDVEASDPEGDAEGAGLTYSVAGGSDRGAFSIDPDFGLLEFIVPPEFANPTDSNLDNVYVVRVQVRDSGGRADRQTIRVTVVESDGAPVITSDGGGAEASIDVFEHTSAVTDVEATDPDGDTEGAGLSYSMSGADAAAFALDAATGVAAFVLAPDFEDPTDVGGTPGDNVYEVTVIVIDSTGRTDSQDLSVSVINQNEAPSAIALTPAAVDENVPLGTVVGTLSTDDPDEGEVHGYSLVAGPGDTHNGLFVISGTALVTSDSLDYELLDSPLSVRLMVTDAGGLTHSEAVTIVLNDLDEIEPTVTKLVAADAVTTALFGISVAISGDTAVVGALFIDGYAGAAYVFTRTDGAWDAGTKLVAPDAADADFFGGSVAISGDTVVVGAFGGDDAGLNSGSAYVFTRSDGVWDAGTKLLTADGAEFDEFGSAVAISGDTVVVGAAADDNLGLRNAGSAYVFTRSGGVWDSGTKVVAADGAADDGFGGSVAISGDTVVVGAALDDNAAGTDAGAAYVFTRSGGVWDAGTKVVAADGAAGDGFGGSVAISGDILVAGALADSDGGLGSGAAYVFTRSGAIWDVGTKLVSPDAADFDFFGRSVAIFGETVVIGVAFDDDAGINSGSAYVFTPSAESWVAETKLLAPDGGPTDEFGTSVAISGNTVVVGAAFDDLPAGTDAGSAYAFDNP